MVFADTNTGRLKGEYNGNHCPLSFQSLRGTISELKQIADLQISGTNNGSSFKLLNFGHGCHVAKAPLDMQAGNIEERSEQGL